MSHHEKIASRCPRYESIRSAQGYGVSWLNTRDYKPRCDQCVFWYGGTCDLFLARG